MTPELKQLAEALKPAPLLLTNEKAAAYCGFSTNGWADIKSTGKGPRTRRVPGRATLMYSRKDLDEWVEKLEKDSSLPQER